ncbi:MAG: HAD family hydrolase [Gammaproteobacteria bacterium]|nr:HAD family hydrolase [Gammaproteobacteria bacterium]
MSLAIFDLDNTLLNGDSDYLWGEFLVEQGLVNSILHKKENNRFYEQYKSGTLNIFEFLNFSLKPLSENDIASLSRLHQIFMHQKIEAIILPKAIKLINKHKAKGDHTLIITATNHFVAAPIAKRLSIETLIATNPELVDGRYTGRVSGTPCFQHGKVERLEQWLTQTTHTLKDSWFYSDSHNDIPLLSLVSHPVAVDPDTELTQHAKQNHWKIISLRKKLDTSCG